MTVSAIGVLIVLFLSGAIVGALYVDVLWWHHWRRQVATWTSREHARVRIYERWEPTPENVVAFPGRDSA